MRDQTELRVTRETGAPPAVSVGIVSICGPYHLRRCLEALRRQADAPPFEIIVAYDPAIDGMPALGADFPEARLVVNEGQRTPLELASRAIQETRGEQVFLTEDHCVPHERWIANGLAALDGQDAAVGGVVALGAGATAVDFAFYFVDFFRYADPIIEGPSPTLTVCNVVYRRSALEQLDSPRWKAFFHETAVNDALRARFGPLRLTSSFRVTMHRHVALADAIRERYAFGRLFGCTRIAEASAGKRLAYRLGSPLLPLLLLGRMIGKGMQSRELAARLTVAIVPLTLMVLAWSLGEWLGYLTLRVPADLTVAREIGDKHARGGALA